MKKPGWGWGRGRSENSWREAEDPAFSKAGANGYSSLLSLGLILLLAAFQISAFSPSLHAPQQYPRMLLLRCPISTTTGQPACPSGYPVPLWMERNIGKAMCGSSAISFPNTPHFTFAEVKYIFVQCIHRTEIVAHVYRALWTQSPQSFQKD